MAPVDRLEEARSFHAKLMAAASGTDDPRHERVFHLVPREVFMGPGPWKIAINRQYIETPSADPIHLYQNSLVALDASRSINNGEPYLHAAWIGAVAPRSGETVVQIGAGTGYYSAILATLVLPDGHVWAYEINEALARRATDNLEAFDTVTVVYADATTAEMPPCDLIYVNAGVASPPAHWLQALRPGGRIIFPWQFSEAVGATMIMTRREEGFAVRRLGWSWFIPCIGASDAELCKLAPTVQQVPLITEGWLTSERAPDETAVAICASVWFSAQEQP